MKLFIDVFGLKIPGYGLSIAIGLCFVILFLYKQRIYKDLDFDTGLSALLYALITGGVFAKILYWITDPSSFYILFDTSMAFKERFQIAFQGGLVFIGGLMGAVLGMYLFLRKYKHLDPLKTIDIFAIGMPILQMFGRVGCFLAGCCYGKACESPISVVFPPDGLAPAGIPLLPTQLFGVIGNFIIIMTLLLYNKKERQRGRTFGLYLTMYSIGRFILEFFRGDEIRGIYNGLSTSQWLSFPIFVAGIYFLIRKEKAHEENTVDL